MIGLRMIVAIILPACLIATACGVAVRGVDRAVRSVATSKLFHRGRTGALTPQEREWAMAAWRYFDVNRQPETGLVASVIHTQTVTMWQIADYIAALIAARELRLIDATQFDERFRRITHFLNVMELYEGRIPNRTYHTASSKPLNAAFTEGPHGWSAIDLGRLLLWLRIARDRYPQYAEYTDKAILRWNFCDVIDREGVLHGGVHADGKTNTFPEGRLGYEEYAAAGFRAWGFTTTRASALDPIETVRIYGIDLPIDGRDPRVTGTPAPVVTLPWVLLGLELDWRDDVHAQSQAGGVTRPLADIATLIYRIQEERFRREQIYTARTDHQIGRAPWYVFDSVHAGGYPFNTTAPDGAHQPQASLVSTRAAFGLWALWNTDYTTRLMTVVEPLHHKERGWFEGRLEQTGGAEELLTSTTNAVVLEALLYKVQGPLFDSRPRPGYFDLVIANEFARPPHCLPQNGLTMTGTRTGARAARTPRAGEPPR
jgi:hypothetical protein